MLNSIYQSNASKNRNKLVSFFDLYQTLRHFLFVNKHGGLTNEQDEVFNRNSKDIRNQRGVSLFGKVPQNRSCLDAYIPDRLCSCFKEDLITETEFAADTLHTFNSAGQLIVDLVNSLTSGQRSLCKVFELDRIVSFRKIFINKIKLYKSVVVLKPGDAWFETSFKINGVNTRRLVVNENPARLSAYGNQSHCIKDTKLVNFCFC